MKYLFLLVFCVPAALCFFVCYAIRWRQPWVLLLAATLGGALPAGFLASAASAMATATSSNDAVRSGLVFGGAIGL